MNGQQSSGAAGGRAGIGLTVVRSILDAHGGTVETVRTAEDHVLVRVVFPAAAERSARV
jgi:nitrogen-specific signal transduction histidine kinase